MKVESKYEDDDDVGGPSVLCELLLRRSSVEDCIGRSSCWSRFEDEEHPLVVLWFIVD